MTVEEQKTQIKASAAPALAEKNHPRGFRALIIIVLAGALFLAAAVSSSLISRARANSALQRQTLQDSIPTVGVIHPQKTSGAEEVVLPGNMRAFIDTPIWARASGYLKAWYVDIGAHVKQGQLLAQIEAPEVEQQLEQAKEDLNTAQANLKLSQITADRYTGLFKTDSVAKQDVDNAVQDAQAKAATVKAAQANVSRLQQMVAYEKVYAPFEGVITARNVDVGALVDADTNTPGKELFHLASTSTLRVYVNVPEAYSRSAKPGVSASLTLNEFPGREFKGMVVRNSDAIDVNSRTLLVEVDVRNPSGELLPGSYVSVHLKLPSKLQAVVIPANALLFRSEGLRVAIVRNGRTVLQPVLLGRDFGDTVEVVSGLASQDSVIVNPSDSIVSGEEVNVTRGSIS
jgi:RND family efflux transporter MFP subunit